MAEATWFYQTSDDKKVGPITTAQLQDLIASGTIPLSTPVMAAETDQWVGARMIPEFRRVAPAEPVVASAQPPAPRRLALNEPPEINYSEYQFEPHPWLRFFARSVDRSISLIPCMVMLIAFSSPDGPAFPPILLLAAYYLVWVVVEARLLSQFGTTPGKSALGISVETESGARPTFEQALRRSALVLLKGEGLGIPVVSLITQIVAYQNLSEQRVSTWDRDCELRVRHRDCGMLRVVAVLFLVWISAVTVAVVAGEIAFVRNVRSGVAFIGKRVPPNPQRQPSNPVGFAMPRTHAYTTEIQNGRLVPFVDGVDERVKMLCGRWRDIRPVGKTTANIFDLLDFNPDGTFRERLLGPDQHGRVSVPLGQWSGTWRIYGKSLILEVTSSNAAGRPTGRWNFNLVELDPGSLVLGLASFPPDFDPGPHKNGGWSFLKIPPEVVQTQ